MLMRLDARKDGLGNFVDLPDFYNEHRSMAEIDADDIPGSDQLENWVSYYLDIQNIESNECLSIDRLIYTVTGQAKLGEDIEFPRGYLEHLGYGVVPINRCSGNLGLSAIEDELTEGDESFKINFWLDESFSNLLYSDEIDVIDTSRGSAKVPGGVPSITNIITNNTNNITTTSISNSGSGDITVGNIGTVNNTTTIDNSFTIQTTIISLSLAITGDSKKSEKVEGTDGDDLIADGRGKDKLIGGDGADQFYFSGEEPFKKKTVDKVIDFDASEGDAIVIADEVVGDLNEDPTLAIADTKKELKQLSKYGYDLLYFEPKGDLYVDGNGDSKGFGKKSEGGMIADLPNDTVLTESDVLIGV